jgi:hypothetical protein
MTVPQSRADRISTGIAGEFLVAGELAKRSWISTLTAKNTPKIDVLAARADLHARVQVKTRTPAYRRAWRVGKGFLEGERDFVVLVDLGEEEEPPKFWILPAAEANRLIVNEQLRTADVETYLGQWGLLE